MNTTTTSVEALLVSTLLYALKVLGIALAVSVLALFGWAVASLHLLAGWGDGGLASKLQIIRGMLASIGAGGFVALAGYAVDMPIVFIALGVFLAGMAGERYLIPASELILGRINAIVSAAIGNGNGSKPTQPVVQPASPQPASPQPAPPQPASPQPAPPQPAPPQPSPFAPPSQSPKKDGQ